MESLLLNITKLRARERAQQLEARAALSEALGLFPTPTRQLKADGIPVLGEPASSLPRPVPVMHVVQTHMQAKHPYTQYFLN